MYKTATTDDVRKSIMIRPHTHTHEKSTAQLDKNCVRARKKFFFSFRLITKNQIERSAFNESRTIEKKNVHYQTIHTKTIMKKKSYFVDEISIE